MRKKGILILVRWCFDIGAPRVERRRIKIPCLWRVIWQPSIARFMGPTWGPSGADSSQLGPMLTPWTLLSGTSTCIYKLFSKNDLRMLIFEGDRYFLTHWGWVTHICVSKVTTIGSDNGLSPGWRQAIIRTNAEILLNGPVGTNFSENVIGIQTFSFKKMPLKMSSAKLRPFCLGLNVLIKTDKID